MRRLNQHTGPTGRRAPDQAASTSQTKGPRQRRGRAGPDRCLTIGRFVFGGALALAIVAAGCTDTVRPLPGLLTFEVTWSDGTARGSLDAPLDGVAGTACTADNECPSGQSCRDDRCHRCATLSVSAIANDGENWAFSGTVAVRADHASVAPSTARLAVDAGSGTGVVCLTDTAGGVQVWVEDDGNEPNGGQCRDDIDNDGNGYVDEGDPGCTHPEDGLEAPVSGAVGLAPALTFAAPMLSAIQRTDRVQTSAFEGRTVRLDGGLLQVMYVAADGFYVTDVTQSVPNGLFVASPSSTPDVAQGDMLCVAEGRIGEVDGHTTLLSAVWVAFSADDPSLPPDCTRDLRAFLGESAPALPLPGTGTDLSDEIVDEATTTAIEANALLLEAHESSLVRFKNVALPRRLIACDRDDDGAIDGAQELTCQELCRQDPNCSPLEWLLNDGLWFGDASTRKKMAIDVRLANTVNPLPIRRKDQDDPTGQCVRALTDDGFTEHRCPERRLESVTGVLRHHYGCNPTSGDNLCLAQRWSLLPRTAADQIFPAGLDQDGDGTTPLDGDCNDFDPRVRPGAPERVGNGTDDDCDGDIQ